MTMVRHLFEHLNDLFFKIYGMARKDRNTDWRMKQKSSDVQLITAKFPAIS